MSDGGAFRAAPTGERVVGKRGRPLAGKIAGIVAVVLIATFGSLIAITYPFMHGSALELAQTALSAQADAVAHFLERPQSETAKDRSIPEQVLDLLEEADVTAVVVPIGANPVEPMSKFDSQLPGRSLGDIRTLADGTIVFYEYRQLRNGASVFLIQPTDVAEEATRTLVGRLALGSAAAILFAMVIVSIYTRRATRPIKNAVRAAERMGEGARDVRLEEGGVAEFADLARSMNALSDALVHSEDRQRQFLLSVSHELRTPLTAIAGYTEALSDGVVDSEDVQEIAQIMRSESERLQRLVSDLLDLSRAGAIEIRLTPTHVEMTDLIREAGQVWEDRCEREGVRFTLVNPSSSLPVTTDPLRVRQIIDNLCENALRVTPEGQPLVLELRDAPGGVDLEVRDGGPGLTEDDLTVAFEPSALHDRYVGIRPVGTGVGLALVGTLAARLGGTAAAGRAAEGGARFTVHLPRDWAMGRTV